MHREGGGAGGGHHHDGAEVSVSSRGALRQRRGGAGASATRVGQRVRRDGRTAGALVAIGGHRKQKPRRAPGSAAAAVATATAAAPSCPRPLRLDCDRERWSGRGPQSRRNWHKSTRALLCG